MKKLILVLSAIMLLASCSAQLNEKVEVMFPDGKPQIVHYYDKSGQCVKEKEYYETGQLKMEGALKDGLREGEWKAYFPDGRLQSIGTFKNDMRTGAATVWQENGNLLYEGFYKEGKQTGLWKWYDEQGDLLKEVDHGE